MRVAIIHHPVDFKISCGQLHKDWRSFCLQVSCDFLIPLEVWWGREERQKAERTEWAMTRSEEEDSVAKETQQVEFIKPMRDLLLPVRCLFSSPLHLKILHKRLLIKYNKLFSFHFKFVAYLKFPDLCTGIRRVWVGFATDNWHWNSFKKRKETTRHFPRLAILFLCADYTTRNGNLEEDEAVDEG